MIDPSDRIVRINEALSFLFERERKSFEQLRTERMAERVKQNELRGQLRAQADARKTAENDKFIKRWNSDDEIKRLGLDTNKLPTDPLNRARAIRKASWQSVQDTLARQPKFEDTPLGKQAAAERKRIAQREIGDAVPEGTSPEDMEALYYGEIKTQMASARQYDAMTPGQKQAERDRQAQARIANWEAGQRQKMLDRIGARGEAGAEYVAAEGEARAAEENLRNVNANQKSLAQIRAENLKSREDLERQIRGENPRAYSESDPTQDQQAQIITNRLTRGLNYFKPKQANPDSQSSASDRPTSTQAQTGYEFYNRDSGQIERSNAPGVDRVFRDSSGKAYRIEGGSGRKVYV